jgi:hypothetical protein
MGYPPVVVVESGGVPRTQVAEGVSAPAFTVVTSGARPITLADGHPPIALFNEDGSPYTGGEVPAMLAPATRVVITDGDSRPAQNQGLTNTAALFSQRILVGGYEMWMQLAAENNFTLGLDYSLGGDDTAECLANQSAPIAALTAAGGGTYIPLIGVNDGTIAVAQTILNYEAIFDNALAVAGTVVAANTDLPYTSIVGGAGGAGAIEHLALVDWLQGPGPASGARAGKVSTSDTFAHMLKPATVIDFIDGDSSDGLHPNHVGHRRLGTFYGADIKDKITWPGDHPGVLPTAAGGTLNNNPMMTGTTGTKGTGTSGTVATGWGLTQFNIGPATVVASKDTDPDGYDRQLIDITGTPTTANNSVTLTQSSVVSNVSLTGLVPGAKVRGIARIYFLTPDPATRIYAAGSVSIRLVGTILGVAHTETRTFGYQSASQGHIVDGYDYACGFMTPDLVIPTDMIVTSAFMEIAIAGGANEQATCRVGVSRAAMRIVT